MAYPRFDSEEQRRRYVNAWNDTMLKIWRERIEDLHVIDTRHLYDSPALIDFKEGDDGRLTSFDIKFGFTEYGLWQDLGTGREIRIGNPGDVRCLDPDYREAHKLNKPRKRGEKWGGGYSSGNPRKPRHWFSTAYYSSTLNMRDFLAQSLGREFTKMFMDLDAENYRNKTDYYRRKGLAP